MIVGLRYTTSQVSPSPPPPAALPEARDDALFDFSFETNFLSLSSLPSFLEDSITIEGKYLPVAISPINTTSVTKKKTKPRKKASTTKHSTKKSKKMSSPANRDDSELETVDEPRETDILCGKDKTYSKHPGNQLYNQLIEDSAVRYNQSTSKQDKMKLTRTIVATMRVKHHGRFVRPMGEKWEVLSDAKARDKTSHALRFAGQKVKDATHSLQMLKEGPRVDAAVPPPPAFVAPPGVSMPNLRFTAADRPASTNDVQTLFNRQQDYLRTFQQEQDDLLMGAPPQQVVTTKRDDSFLNADVPKADPSVAHGGLSPPDTGDSLRSHDLQMLMNLAEEVQSKGEVKNGVHASVRPPPVVNDQGEVEDKFDTMRSQDLRELMNEPVDDHDGDGDAFMKD